MIACDWNFNIEAAPTGKLLLLTANYAGGSFVVTGGFDASWSGQCWVYSDPRIPRGTTPVAWCELPAPAKAGAL